MYLLGLTTELHSFPMLKIKVLLPYYCFLAPKSHLIKHCTLCRHTKNFAHISSFSTFCMRLSRALISTFFFIKVGMTAYHHFCTVFTTRCLDRNNRVTCCILPGIIIGLIFR